MPLRARVRVAIEQRPVWGGGWLYELEGHKGGRQPVLLLDTDLADNAPEDRQITAYLYRGGPEYRLRQEIVLGIGGVRNHRKLLVIDDTAAFLGGFNITERNSRCWYGEDRLRDTHLRVTGASFG